MATHKYIDRICVLGVVFCILLTIIFMNGESLGMVPSVSAAGYESRLFDTSRVHHLDLVIDDWDGFLDTAQSEEYTECTLVIDGEAYQNIAIRGKGNTSLRNVASMDSSRYSFKIEFDHYDSSFSYYGLDKLSLNNIIQDNTYMKDYLTYRMMNAFGVSAPLCSYVYLTVNGADWGLYLAAEGVEDAFLRRNYGNAHGELYKPDSASFGGGRGNGRAFDFQKFMDSTEADTTENAYSTAPTDRRGKWKHGGFGQFPPSDVPSDIPQAPDGSEWTEFPQDKTSIGGKGMFGGGMGGMGSDDVKLKYTDDSYDSYSNIFENAKTDITDADKDRLIAALKSLSEQSDLENVVAVESVIRYFVVHNYVCNGDSYTGSMIHNYYLYEENGRLSMIPWDYNLAFGTFQSSDAAAQVNAPIDSPVSGDITDRPMISWIFGNDAYTAQYHQYFSEFLDTVDITAIIDETTELIAEYVEKDPTKFCTYEEFQKGAAAIRTFCTLRTQSVRGQLDGTIPATAEGQTADRSALVDASGLTLADMGTMQHGGGNKDQRNPENIPPQQTPIPELNGEIQKTARFLTAAPFPSANDGNIPPMGEMPPGGGIGGMNGIQPPDGFTGEMPANGYRGEMPDFNGMEFPTEEAGGNANAQAPTPGNGQLPDSGNPQMPQDTAQPQTNTSGAYLLLFASVIILGGGLLFAWKFKR